jgi:hypothetical protein
VTRIDAHKTEGTLLRMMYNLENHAAERATMVSSPLGQGIVIKYSYKRIKMLDRILE